MLLLLNIYSYYLQSRQHRRPQNISTLTGRDYVQELLPGHSDRMYDLFRMDRHVFLRLCDTLQELDLLRNQREVSVHEVVAIFLFIVSHSIRMRVAAIDSNTQMKQFIGNLSMFVMQYVFWHQILFVQKTEERHHVKLEMT